MDGFYDWLIWHHVAVGSMTLKSSYPIIFCVGVKNHWRSSLDLLDVFTYDWLIWHHYFAVGSMT